MQRQFDPAMTRRDQDLLRERLAVRLERPQTLPIRFTYDGAVYNGLPSDAKAEKTSGSDRCVIVYAAELAPALRVKAECVLYSDAPVCEWTVWFTNAGDADSGLLEDVRALELPLAGAQPRVLYNNGDFYSAESYTDAVFPLPDGAAFTQAPFQGRPCDQAFPYHRVLFDGFGALVAVGWPGQWEAAYTGTADGVLLRAGQQTVHTLLHPGETLRTPRMAVLLYDAQGLSEEEHILRGVNLWRRWFGRHVTPQRDGRMLPPRSVVTEHQGGIEWQDATAEGQLAAVDFTRRNLPDINMLWIDAGWYPCKGPDGEKQWDNTGSWYPDPERFPDGLAPVGRACREAGMELLVWFEPERVRVGSALCAEHPDWLLDRADPDGNFLLDLTRPDCLAWLSETIGKLLADSGITCYRQDFNFDPLPYWRHNETADRQGMVENLYVQGYLAYWDSLLARAPGLWIDSCASGGRRNDLETMRRAVPLHPTDYGYGYHHINQSFRNVLLHWFNYVRGWAQAWDADGVYFSHDDYYAKVPPALDSYSLINGFGSLSMFGQVQDFVEHPESVPLMNQLLAVWKRFAPLQQEGDYYPLTPAHRDFTRWTVLQFDCPEAREGALQCLRNNQCEEETFRTQLYNVRTAGRYTFTDGLSGEERTVSGAQLLADGFSIALPKRGAAIWFYQWE